MLLIDASDLLVRPYRELLKRARVGQALGDDLAGEVIDQTNHKLGHVAACFSAGFVFPAFLSPGANKKRRLQGRMSSSLSFRPPMLRF